MFLLLFVCVQEPGDVGYRDRDDGSNVDKRWLCCQLTFILFSYNFLLSPESILKINFH